MTANGWFQIVLFLALILAITKPLGVYMAKVFSGERTFFDPVARPVERLLYRVTGVDEQRQDVVLWERFHENESLLFGREVLPGRIL